MKTKLILSKPAEVESECLAVVVLDHSESKATDNGNKEKPAPKVASSDAAVAAAAAEVIKSGELTGKSLEIVLLHSPQGVKAKRLLLIGGGKAKNFSASELRKLSGAAVRYLKPRSIRSLSFAVPDAMDAAEAVKAIVEGAFVGDFETDTYRSDRKDQKLQELAVMAPAGAKKEALQQAL